MMRTVSSAFPKWLFAVAACAAAALPCAAIADDGDLHVTPLFRKFGVADGMPSSSVHALAEDRAGFIWIATVDGLARYDGTGFRIFRHDTADANSIGGNDVTTIFIDRDDRIWCGLESHGLDVLDESRSAFRHFVNDPADPRSLVADDVWSIGQDNDGSLWLGSGGSGLDRLRWEGSRATFEHTTHDESNPRSIGSDKIVAVYAASNGDMWFGTDFGLDVYRNGGYEHVDFSAIRTDRGRLNVRKLAQRDGVMWAATNRGLVTIDSALKVTLVAGSELTHQAVFAFAHDAAGEWWIGTQHGLNRRDTAGNITGFVSSETLPGTIGGNLIPDVLSDHEGNVWIASDDGGLMQLSATWRNFSLFRHDAGDAHSLSANRAQGLSVDARGGVWAVNLDGGIDRLDPKTGFVERYADRLAAPVSKGLFAATQDTRGKLWLGHAAGARIYDLDKRTFRDLNVHPDNADALGGGVTGFSETPDAMWATTNGRGLHRIDAESLRIHRFDADDAGLRSDDINRIGVDPLGALLVAGAAGLDRYDTATNTFSPLPGIPDGAVVEFSFARDGSLWVLEDGALEHFCAPPKCASDTYTSLARYAAADGWQTATFTGMQVDAMGNVWVSGPRGLWRYDPEHKRLRTFGAQDGLISAEFNDAALVQRNDGTIFGATLAGIVGFDPSRVQENTLAPKLVVDRVSVTRDGQPVSLDPKHPVELTWRDRNLSFVARALSYANPSGNRYQWQLENFDSDWVDSGNRGEREFSQLPPGEYRLRLRAANASGTWSAPIDAIALNQASPPWATRWAFALYALALFIMAWLIIRAYRYRIERRHAYELSQQQRQFAERANAAKTDFLATMGHEIRTPMTGVLGMTELLLRTPLDMSQRGFAEAIQKSGRVLLRLVNDSLDLARIDAGKFELDEQDFDLHELMRDIESLERPIAEAKGLAFAAPIHSDAPRFVRGDAVRVQQIVLNLVNNAIKFSERGTVTLELVRASDGIQFRISDTGPGISKSTRQRLFQRFAQADGPQRRVGSGLGLAICRELVGHMGGQIELDSTLGAGSTFRVTLPLREAAPIAVRAVDMSKPISNAKKILLVEDDATVAAVIAGLLRGNGHDVAHVANGLAALAEIETARFDVALIDLDLPGVDGLALTRLLRAREASRGSAKMTLIGISARSVGDEEALCLGAGMDAFVRKPISGEMLEECLDRFGS
ncbi:MAG: ATP-binding protein [Rudaea sp.]